MTMNTDEVLLEISEERMRQESLKESGKFVFTCADKGLSEAEKLAVLSEEIGEVSKEVVELVIGLSKLMKLQMSNEARSAAIEETIKEYKVKARKELVQVAGVAVAWVEALSDN